MKTKDAITALLLAVTIVGVAAACKGGEEHGAASSEEQKPIVLGQQDVSSVKLMALNSGVLLTGTLQPAQMVSVKAQVPGTIAAFYVDRGVRVAQGQALAVIRAEGIRGQAEGARAGVAAAEANLAVAQQRLESARTLRQAGALSEIDFKAAAAGYEAARAQVAAARASAAGAAEAAGNATVRAPFNGVVGARSVEVGQAVNPGDELFTVVRSEFLELSGQVAVEQAALIRPGQRVVFTLDAYPDREFGGEVSRIEPIADPNTRQVGVYLRMRNPGNLIGGQFATGRIQMAGDAEVLAIPETSIRGAGADTHVFAIVDDKLVKRVVTLGRRDPATGVIEVKSGLQAGETIVVAPTATILEGARVQVGNDQ